MMPRRASREDPEEEKKLEYCSICNGMHRKGSKQGKRCRLKREIMADKERRAREART